VTINTKSSSWPVKMAARSAISSISGGVAHTFGEAACRRERRRALRPRRVRVEPRR
jgi:hypothetical protein